MTTTAPADRTHVALLRGINVGKAKRVAMAELRELVGELGYGNVSTLLNSGNVVFTIPVRSKGDAGPRIEQALAKRMGFTARVTVITAQELGAIVAVNPLAKVASDPSRLLVHVLARPADRARLEPLAKKTWTPDALALSGRVAYVWCASGMLESKLAAEVSRALGDSTTARNWATMTKLHALASTET